MSDDVINSWIERAKQTEAVAAAPVGIKVIKRENQNRGNIIMDIAEKIRPHLMKMFEGVRDENEMLVQPSTVRGMALNVAQHIVAEQEKKTA